MGKDKGMRETLYPHQQKGIILLLGIICMVAAVTLAIIVVPEAHSAEGLSPSAAWCTTQTSLQNNFTWIDASPIILWGIGFGIVLYWFFTKDSDKKEIKKLCPYCKRELPSEEET